MMSEGRRPRLNGSTREDSFVDCVNESSDTDFRDPEIKVVSDEPIQMWYSKDSKKLL